MLDSSYWEHRLREVRQDLGVSQNATYSPGREKDCTALKSYQKWINGKIRRLGDKGLNRINLNHPAILQ